MTDQTPEERAEQARDRLHRDAFMRASNDIIWFLQRDGDSISTTSLIRTLTELQEYQP